MLYMDFLDPKKQKAHAVRIWIGYGLIGMALLLASVVLLYQAYGFRINRQGEIIQNGLVFVSSQPADAEIYLNGQRYRDNTNARLSLPAGQYTFELRREGYHDWKRGIAVEGGSVQRFAYPFLFPVDLRTQQIKTYEQPPALLTQSLDRRWLLVQSGAEAFDLFDLDKEEPAARPVNVPAEILSADTVTTGWQEVEWSDGNRRVVLKRLFSHDGQNGSEYILFDREQPEESLNLTVLLGFNPTILELRDSAHDQYYAFDKNSGVLFTAGIDQPTPQPLLRDVLGFKSDGTDSVLYATNEGADEGRTLVRLKQGDQTYTLRQLPQDKNYLLDLGRFQGALLVAAGAQKEGRVYVYADPQERLRDNRIAAPAHILKAGQTEQMSFSVNARFIMARAKGSFAVYDFENDRGYAYELDVPEGARLGAAEWMDGHRLTLTVGNELTVFDYDGTNRQTLLPVRRGFEPAFNPAFTFLYTLSAKNELNQTSLRTPADE